MAELDRTTRAISLEVSTPAPQWCIVRSYWDNSGRICSYGPFTSEANANAAVAALEQHGIQDKLEVMRIHRVAA